MKLVIDTREQLPFSFENEKYKDVTLQKGTLSIGDYSILGFENSVAVERKSLADLVGCLGRDRERFERELQRARGLDSFCVCVVVEASFIELAKGQYRVSLHTAASCKRYF